MEKAAVWVDSRYYIQANDQLDPDDWILMKACKTKKCHN
jgi:hypothetical protein